MNFLKLKSTWTTAELGIIKVCVAAMYLVVGAYFHNFIHSYYWPLLIVGAACALWAGYLWLKKVKAEN